MNVRILCEKASAIWNGLLKIFYVYIDGMVKIWYDVEYDYIDVCIEKYHRYKMNGHTTNIDTINATVDYMCVKEEQNFIHKFYRSIKHIALTILVTIISIIIANEFYMWYEREMRNKPFNAWTIKYTQMDFKNSSKYVISGWWFAKWTVHRIILV